MRQGGIIEAIDHAIDHRVAAFDAAVEPLGKFRRPGKAARGEPLFNERQCQIVIRLTNFHIRSSGKPGTQIGEIYIPLRSRHVGDEEQRVMSELRIVPDYRILASVGWQL